MELQKLYISLLMDMREYTAGLDDAVRQAGSFGDRIKGTLGGAARTAGLAVAGGLTVAGGALMGLAVSSVGVASDFQSSMAIMSTAVDPVSLGVETAAEAMGVMSDAALAVGSDTALVGVSASTSAEAITGLYKAGLTTSEIFGDLQGYLAGTSELSGALRASIDLAAASELDMVQASDLAAVTLATFGGELKTEAERAEFINKAMNNFVQTADASVASVQDLADAFTNVGPTANAMGMNVSSVNTALGIMSMRGITGAEAGTQLKSMLLNMTALGGPAEDALTDLGVSLYDLQGNMRPLEAIIGQVETALVGMTQEQQNFYIKSIAGSYGIGALNSLLAEGAEGWAAMEEATYNAATMQETAAARTNTLAGAQEALSGVWESFKIQIGTALIPILTTLAGLGSTLLEKYGPVLTGAFESLAEIIASIQDVFTGFTNNLREGMSPIDAFIEAIWDMAPQPVLDALIMFRDDILPHLKEGFDNIVRPLLDAVAGFVSWKDVLVGLGVVIATAVMPVIGGIIGALVSVAAPLLAVIAVVALLRNAWENNWGGIQDKVAAVMGFIGPLIQTAIGAVIAWWTANWPQIQTTIETVWGIVQTVIETAIDVIRPALGALMENGREALGGLSGLVEPLQELWGKVGPFVQAAATVIGGILTGLLGLIVGIVKGVSQAIEPFIKTFINLAENLVRIVGGILDTLTGVFKLIIGLVTGNTELIKDAWEQMKTGVMDIVGGLVTGVVELISGLWDTLVELVSGLVDGVMEFFADLYDGLVGHSIVVDLVEDVRAWFETMLTWISEVLVNLWKTVSDPFLTMWEELKIWFLAKADEIKGIGSALIGGLKAGIEAGLDSLRSIIQDVADAIPQWLKEFLGIASPAKTTIPMGQAIVEGVIEGIRLQSDGLEEAIDIWIVQSTQGLLDALLAVGNDWGSLAGGFARHFERLVTDPMGEQVESLTGVLDRNMPRIAKRWEEVTGLAMPDWNDRSFFDSTLAQLYRFQRGVMPNSDLAESIQESIDAMVERNGLEAEYIRQQERLAALEKARADLDFLKQQMDLLDMLGKHNISLDVLNGVQLGVAADPGQLMDLMVDVLNRIVLKTSYQLGSMSTVPSVTAPTPGTRGAATYNVNEQTINGGQHNYFYGREESELEELLVQSR